MLASPPSSSSANAIQAFKIPNLCRTLVSRAESAPPNSSNRPTPRNPRKKSSYGASRRSILKKSFNQEQVVFKTPLADDPVVAVIGGGMSGLICALFLEKRGIRSTVFDTGLHGLGGRMGTRIIDPQPLIFDHAAQFFNMTDPRFSELVDGWLKSGLIREWLGPIGVLEAGGHFTPDSSSSPRYIGVNGMRPLADSILSKRLELSSIWALLAAFEEPLPFRGNSETTPFEGAFVKEIDALSWMGNNTKKLLFSQRNFPHCWTFFSTAAYGKRNKVPQASLLVQERMNGPSFYSTFPRTFVLRSSVSIFTNNGRQGENIPSSTAEKVKLSMLEGVEIALGLSKGSLQKPLYTRLQLWGAALPTNTPAVPCIFDPQGRAGICGDWLLGSNLEAAALSGMALAHQIADYWQSGGSCPDEFAVGLHNEFKPIEGHDIGQFPGLKCKPDAQQAMKLGFVRDGHVRSSAIRMYAKCEADIVCCNDMIVRYLKCGDVEAAMALFEVMEEKNVGSWNVMISGYARCGKIELRRSCFMK
ncbi:hypothetical protein Sjap_006373 [Stephania japonica]|uniref:Rhodanese domain-containing protein n=1 Tax=Stephania japonica TaxID=461633 RepID=A0AAP0PLX4_9MAGN